MTIRDYAERDAGACARLFFETVRSVNRADYTWAQVCAWAPEIPDAPTWHQRMSQRYTLVAEESDEIVGFGELESDGHLDMLFCRKDSVGQGVGGKLYRALEARAISLGIRRIFAEASLTARGFFERHGFVARGLQSVERQGVQLTNFRMDKLLPSG